MSDAYAKAGVDIDAGARLVRRIAPMAAATARAGAFAGGGLGGFGALFDMKAAGYRDPILVSGADGVGTKLKIAIETGRHEGIGVDLVAMCANDVLAHGAEPLFFLDYFACGRLDEGTAGAVISGIAEGCRRAGCALVGGETAEMPGLYAPGDYDLAGFCVGAVERGAERPTAAAPGDALIGLPSSGPHANGFSLIRKICAEAGLGWDDPAPFAPEQTLGAALLEPTAIYVAAVLPLLRRDDVRAFAHITGGGLTENTPRVLPEGLAPRFAAEALTPPPVFAWLQEAGGLDDAEMRRTFNCGVGGVLVTAPEAVDAALAGLAAAGVEGRVVGDVAAA